MNNLSIQIQSIILTFFFGMFFIASYEFFNRMLYFMKGSLIRFVIELAFFSILSAMFFFLLFFINGGNLNIYLPFIFIGGMIVYYRFIGYYMLSFYELLAKQIRKTLFDPIRFTFKKLLSIIKLKVKRIRDDLSAKKLAKKAIKEAKQSN